MKKKKRKSKKKHRKKRFKKKFLKKKSKKILKKRKKIKVRKKKAKKRIKYPKKTRAVILSLLKANEKIKSGLDNRLNSRALDIKSAKNQAIFHIRHETLKIIRNFLIENNIKLYIQKFIIHIKKHSTIYNSLNNTGI